MSFMTITKVFSWRPLATVSQLLKAVGGRTHLIWELALDKQAQRNRHFFNAVVYGIYDVNIDNVLVSVKTAPRIALCAASWLGEKLASKAINVEVIIEIKKEKLRVTFTPNGKRELYHVNLLSP